MDSYATSRAQQAYQLAGSLLVSNGADALSDAVSTPRRWWAGYQVRSRCGRRTAPARQQWSVAPGLRARVRAAQRTGCPARARCRSPPACAPRPARRSAACTCGPHRRGARPLPRRRPRTLTAQAALRELPGRITRPGPMLARMNPQVEIVVPVYNEELALGRSIRRLHDFLRDGFPFSWRIVIADNASTDAHARDRARARRASCRGVSHLRLDEKGRGRALRAAWSASRRATSSRTWTSTSRTDLRALLPLVAPLLSGHSDLAIGTRLAGGARVVRGPKRELISRSYNRILRTVLRARFSDAQCGFKAVRRDGAARPARRRARQRLVLRHRAARARPAARAADPRGAGRLGRRPRLARGDRAHGGRRPARRRAADGRRAGRALHGRRRALARSPTRCSSCCCGRRSAPTAANASALALTAVGNTAANRRFTFGVRGRAGLVRQHAHGRARVLPHARADERRAGRAARARLRAGAPARARGADRRRARPPP